MTEGQRTRATEVPGAVDMVEIEPEAREVIESALRVARERLRMEIGWLAEFRDDRKVFRVVEGDTGGWDIHPDDFVSLADDYCRRMYDGRIPNAIRDTAAEPAVATLPVTQRLGISSYVGVPLLLPDGRLRGAFCCARRTPHLTLNDRDVRFIQVLARLVADELSYREALKDVRRLERRTAGTAALLSALHVRDRYTADHSTAVVALARAVARRLGVEGEELEEVEDVALLHDIGKIGIPDTILHKPWPLRPDEERTMRDHPALGAELAAGLPHLAHLADAIRAEHERWDGNGYPDGLAGEEIPLASRITLVCDGWHAMISDRPYRPALAREHALEELRRGSGTMYWPPAAEALLEELGSAG